MEDLVTFKIFTFWVESDKSEVRRFVLEKSEVTRFDYLNAKLQDVYPGLKEKIYSVAWKDEDGDDVEISTNEELMTALLALKENKLIKLFVYCKGNKVKDDVAGNPKASKNSATKGGHNSIQLETVKGKAIGQNAFSIGAGAKKFGNFASSQPSNNSAAEGPQNSIVVDQVDGDASGMNAFSVGAGAEDFGNFGYDQSAVKY